MFHVSYSESIKIGIPPSYITGLTVAEKVTSEQKTKSPFLIPANFIAKCSAEVPDESATTFSLLV